MQVMSRLFILSNNDSFCSIQYFTSFCDERRQAGKLTGGQADRQPSGRRANWQVGKLTGGKADRQASGLWRQPDALDGDDDDDVVIIIVYLQIIFIFFTKFEETRYHNDEQF